MQKTQRIVDSVGQRKEVLDLRRGQRDEDGGPGVTGRLIRSTTEVQVLEEGERRPPSL